MSEHPRGRVLGTVLLALAGLAIAVALSVAASNLLTQPIGISGEPLRTGIQLAPREAEHGTQLGPGHPLDSDDFGRRRRHDRDDD